MAYSMSFELSLENRQETVVTQSTSLSNGSPPLALQLDADELTFLLNILNIQAVGGFTATHLTAEQAALAQQKLLKRELIAFHEEQLLVDERVAALVGAGAVSSRAMNIHHQFGIGTYSDHWFYFNPQFHVYHSFSYPSVHQFQTIQTVADIMAAVSQILPISLGMDNSSTREGAVEISRNIYQEARNRALTDDVDAATALLEAHGIVTHVALHMFRRESYYEVSLCMIERDTAAAAGFLVFPLENEIWVVEPSQERVRVYLATGTEVLDHIADLVQSVVV